MEKITFNYKKNIEYQKVKDKVRAVILIKMEEHF